LSDDESKWLLGTAIIDGLGMIHRVRTDVRPKALAKRYPFALSLVWSFNARRTFGIPSKRTEARIDRCQDQCELLLEPSYKAVSVAVHTGHGRVVSLWYTSSPRHAKQAIAGEAGLVPGIAHTIDTWRDDKWLSYKKSLLLVGGA